MWLWPPCFIFHSWLMWHYFVVCIFIYITIIIDSFSWFICLLWFFLVNRCLHFKNLHLIFNKFVWFQFVNINEHKLGSTLVSVTSNIIFLGNTYFILYNSNHFLVNFLRCDLLPFGNYKTKSSNLNFFLYSFVDSTKPHSIDVFLISP